jgi:hypothetical protein
MKYAAEMGSGVMIYDVHTKFHKDSGTQKLLRGIHRQHGDRISLLQESRLKSE